MLLTLPTAAALLLALSSAEMGSPALLEESHSGLHPKLTQLRDAPDTRGQQGLLQGPQLQLGVGVSPSVAAHGAIMVGAEVSREGQDTWGQSTQHTSYRSANTCGKANPLQEGYRTRTFPQEFLNSSKEIEQRCERCWDGWNRLQGVRLDVPAACKSWKQIAVEIKLH